MLARYIPRTGRDKSIELNMRPRLRDTPRRLQLPTPAPRENAYSLRADITADVMLISAGQPVGLAAPSPAEHGGHAGALLLGFRRRDEQI